MAAASNRIKLTAGRISEAECPDNKKQHLLWDTQAPSMALRVTPSGYKAFVFEARLHGKTVRITIGPPSAWTLEEARAKAREYQRLVDEGIDPRQQKREALEQAARAEAKKRAEAKTLGETWNEYTAARAPHWGNHTKNDHVKMMQAAGVNENGRKVTAGPLNYFANMRLVDVTPAVVKKWAASEGKKRPTRARLGARLLRAFFNWCLRHDEYGKLITTNPVAGNTEALEKLGKAKAKQDVLLREQLGAFFDAAKGLSTPAVSVYIQTLLLTGARPSELLNLRWADINHRWRSITIRDKDESKGGQDGTRIIPLTPYAHHLIDSLPRRGEWVFSSDTLNQPINAPRHRMSDVAKVAGLEITFQGLRRSYGSLSEWLELPAGVIAQIQGHKPSATAEKHYRVRPLDLLRVHAERFEAWILEQAGIEFDATQQPSALRVVTGARDK